MAKIEFSALFTDAHGSMGGITFQRNASGVIVRSRIKPVNKRTQYTGSSRQIIQQLNLLWRSLTLSEQATWDAAAVSPQNGYGLFMSQNQTAIKILADTTASPKTPQVIDPFTYTLDLNATGDSFMINSSRPTTSDEAAYIMISQTLSPGIKIRPSAVRAIPIAYLPSSTYEFLDDFRDKYGFDPNPGYMVTVSVEICNYIGYNHLIPTFASALTY